MQLPKMPKEYICKLIFDTKHEAIVIKRKDTKIIGGICFRVYEEQFFAEIAFLAITADEQIKGFGTKLMNQLKTQMQNRKIQFLMTYADNLAIRYFKKQGFHESIQIPQEIWQGYSLKVTNRYLKDYDGSTHMECLIDPVINYQEIGLDIKRQRDAVIKKILEMTQNNRVYDGLKISDFKNPSKDCETCIKIESIPGIEKSTWDKKEHDELKRRPKGTSFKSSCHTILDQLEKHKSVYVVLLTI